MHLPLLGITLGLCAVASPAQSFTTFGAGCGWNGVALAIGNQGLPQLGQTFAITYSGPNHLQNFAQQIARPWLALGLTPLAVGLPTNLFTQQPAGCTAYVDALAMTPMPIDPVLPAFESSFALSIPNAPSLLGVQILAQWLTVVQQCGFAGCNIAAALTSDAAVAAIGP